MTKLKLKRQALELRKQGMSFSQIRELLHVSKSTLSIWLKEFPLSKDRISELRGRNEKRIERFRETMKRKKEERLRIIYHEEKAKVLPFSDRDLFLSGLFLYWGEGNKSSPHSVSINNSDPSVVQFALLWLIKCWGISREKIIVYLHVYTDMDIAKELLFWSKTLKIPLSNFNKPYVKESKRTELDHKGFGHGTCGIAVHNSRLKERILMELEVIKSLL